MSDLIKTSPLVVDSTVSGEYEAPDKHVPEDAIRKMILEKVHPMTLINYFQQSNQKHECAVRLLEDCPVCEMHTSLFKAAELLRLLLGAARGQDVNLSKEREKYENK